MKKQNFFKVLILIVLFAFLIMPGISNAATQNFSETISGIQVVPFHISGQYTATTAGVVQFQIPFKAQVLGVSATARTSGGTSPTLTIDVKEAGTTILSAPMSITAGIVTEGVVTDSSLADESLITADFAITGTSPTWNDITLILTLRRTN